jgi:hypothetical protein
MRQASVPVAQACKSSGFVEHAPVDREDRVK